MSESEEDTQDDDDEEDDEETPAPNRIQRNAYQRSDAARRRESARVDADIDEMLSTPIARPPPMVVDTSEDEDADEVDELL